jgi:threonine-phosphate decarboxylase
VKRDHGSRTSTHPATVIDFSSNVNCFGPPACALEAVRCCPEDCIASYPDPSYPELKDALARYTGRRPEELFPANGSVEIFYWLCYSMRPRQVLTIAPCFCEYPLAALAAGASVQEHLLTPADGFEMDLRRVCEQAAGADLVFACNPASPTGRLYPRDAILSIAEAMRAGSVLLLDEAFMDFCEQANSATVLDDISDGVWVSRSLTKFFSLAGLRAGYLVAPPDVIKRLELTAPPWRVNSVAARAATAALSDSAFIESVPGRMATERDNLSAMLARVGLKPFPSAANFLLVELPQRFPDSRTLAGMLLARGFLVRDASTFQGLSDRFVRIAVRTGPENEALASALDEIAGNR